METILAVFSLFPQGCPMGKIGEAQKYLKELVTLSLASVARSSW